MNKINGHNQTMAPRECRICLVGDNQDDLIAPCRCSGTSKWIHRECLDQWRATAARSSCAVCGFHYNLQGMSPRRRYYLLVARDVILAVCMVLAATTGCVFVVRRSDANGELKVFIPRWMPDSVGYYFIGMAVGLMLLGLCAAVAGCYWRSSVCGVLEIRNDNIETWQLVLCAIIGGVVFLVNAVLFWRHVKQRHWHVLAQEFKIRVVNLAT